MKENRNIKFPMLLSRYVFNIFTRKYSAMQRNPKYLILIFFLFIFGCKPDRCLHTTGAIIIEERQPGDFTSVTIEDVFTIEVIPDSSNRIEIVAGEKLLPYISTTNKEQNLTIKNENRCNWLRSFKNKPIVRIYSNSIESIRLEGESDLVFTDTLKQDHFLLDVWAGLSTANVLIDCEKLEFSLNGGSGDFSFSGRAGVCFIHADGNAFVNADKLETGFAYITSITTGDIYIYVTKVLEVRLHRSGNVYYKGEPANILKEQFAGGDLYPIFK
ncbi:MAG: DUF2807 domain-containing protein [Bacteroidales bacterium]|nr:DUF2807 domain-containing protein [Bacteroidales bacterium]MCF8456644.1 DUF2807 domain-containing protein [Bacteroidales bacterium]